MAKAKAAPVAKVVPEIQSATASTRFDSRNRNFDQNVPAIFASIMATSKEDPLVKYRGTFEGVSKSDVASIAQGQAFAAILAQEVARRNLIVPVPVLIAQRVSAAEDYFRVSEMLTDGFPDHQPIHLHFLFSKGETQPEEDRGALEGISSKKNNVLIEVADAVRFWFSGDEQRVLNDIQR